MLFSCHVCEKKIGEEGFMEADALPLYYAEMKNWEIPQNITFCGPICSSKWHRENRDKLRKTPLKK